MTPVTLTVRPLSPWARGVLLASVVAGLLILIIRDSVASAVFFLPYTGLGAYLVTRRPANVVGWLLMLVGWGTGIASSAETTPFEAFQSGRLDMVEALIVWSNACAWSLAFFGMFAITLVFPSGGLPMGRGRWTARAALAVDLAIVVLVAFGPTMYVKPATRETLGIGPNPLAIFPDGQIWSLVPHLNTLYAVMFGLFVTALVGLGLRYRDSTGIERLQYRWLVAAIALVVIATGIWAFTSFVLHLGTRVHNLVVLIAYPTIPIAVTVAILRYRLYDIDRIISRTISYGLVTFVLFGIFAAVNLALVSNVSPLVNNEGIAVAVSTLLVAALFNPVRGRVQRAVDRGFHRARFNADRMVSDFATRLRDEIEIDRLRHDLLEVIDRSVEPTHTDLWLRPRMAR
jgi:hypothetical protein